MLLSTPVVVFTPNWLVLLPWHRCGVCFPQHLARVVCDRQYDNGALPQVPSVWKGNAAKLGLDAPWRTPNSGTPIRVVMAVLAMRSYA